MCLTFLLSCDILIVSSLHRDREPGTRGDGDRFPRGRGGLGRGLGRGMRGGRGGYDSRGKREFDRQSGSDKT